MKLKASLDDHIGELDLVLDGDRLFAKVNDRSYELVIQEAATGNYLLLNQNRVYNCHVEPEVKSDMFAVSLRGRSYRIGIVDPKRLRSGQSSERHHHGSAQILAPMPGKVVRVLVEVGAEVQKGEGIVVVEAMKMQNELKSPRAGIVVAIHVTTGDTVNAADVLAVVED